MSFRSIVSGLFSAKPAPTQDKRETISVIPMDQWRPHLAGLQNEAGVVVNERTAMFVTALFDGVRIIATDVATTPCLVYQKLSPVGKRLLAHHWLASLLGGRPNQEQNYYDYRRTMTAWSILWGNAYSLIERSSVSGNVINLWPIEPWRVRICRDKSGRLYYHINDTGRDYKPADMLHLKGFSLNGLFGEMLSQYGRDAIGGMLAVQKFAARYFGSGARPSGVITTPTAMDTEASKKFLEMFNEMNAGVENSSGTLILTGGKKWEKISNSNDESQFLQTRVFLVDEAARLLRISPTKLGNLGRATWSNLAQLQQDHVEGCLTEYWTMWQAEIQSKLLDNEPDVFVKHDEDRWLRGDPLTRAQVQALRIRSSQRTPNEARAEDGLDPIVGGDIYYISKDMMPAGQVGDDNQIVEDEPEPQTVVPPTNEVNPELPTGNPALGYMMTLASINGRLLQEGMKRALHTEADKVLRQAKKGSLAAWKGDFYSQHTDWVRSIIELPVTAFIESVIAMSGAARLIENKDKLIGIIPQLAQRHVEESLADLADEDDGMLQRVGGWEDHRAELFATSAMDEVVEQINQYLK